MDGATPITIGLITIVAACVLPGIAVVLWLWSKFGSLEKNILAAIDEKVSTMKDDLNHEMASLENEGVRLSDRLTSMILAQAEHRTWVAEHYMSKDSNRAISGEISKSIDTLRQDLNLRLSRVEDRIINKINGNTP